MKPFILTQCSYFGESDHYYRDQAVFVSNGRIEKIVPMNQVSQWPVGVERINAGGNLVAPGFIDIQVNGGGGVMFNEQPTAAGIAAIRRGHWAGGTTAMLPTLITDDAEKMAQAVDAVAFALENVPGIVGIHLEGPHINLAKRGVHAANKIRAFDAFTATLLKRLPARHYLLTVAPEVLPVGSIAAWVKQGIRVSAGHSMASYEQIRTALAEGLSCFTHLYNAMTPMTSREPGVVGAALEDQQSYCGLIVDGFHLHPTVAKLAISAKPRGKVLLVTDAMAVVGSARHHFELYGEKIYALGWPLR